MMHYESNNMAGYGPPGYGPPHSYSQMNYAPGNNSVFLYELRSSFPCKLDVKNNSISICITNLYNF